VAPSSLHFKDCANFSLQYISGSQTFFIATPLEKFAALVTHQQ